MESLLSGWTHRSPTSFNGLVFLLKSHDHCPSCGSVLFLLRTPCKKPEFLLKKKIILLLFNCIDGNDIVRTKLAKYPSLAEASPSGTYSGLLILGNSCKRLPSLHYRDFMEKDLERMWLKSSRTLIL